MMGAVYALTAALSWAGSSTILKSLTTRIDALSLSVLRICTASLFLLVLVPLSGRGAEFISTPLMPLVYVIISGIISQAIGDTIYIKSLSYLNVSQAFPITQCSYPVFTMLLAILLLGESFTWVTGLGTFLVLLGIYLITSTRMTTDTNSTPRRIRGKGIVLAIIAGAVWAIAAVPLKLGIAKMDPLVAAAIREGGYDGPKIRDAMARIKDFPGAAGKMTFDEYGGVVKPMNIMIVKNGKYILYEGK